MKHEFPIFSRTIHGKPLTYLDNAASTQKPLAVIEAMDDCYRHHYSNIHRGVHHLSQQLSARDAAVRAQVARFINAPRTEALAGALPRHDVGVVFEGGEEDFVAGFQDEFA